MKDGNDGTVTSGAAPDLRDVAVRGVDEAQKAFHSLLAASQKALGDTETAAEGIAEGLHALNQQILAATEANAATIFSHLRDVAAADGVEEVMRLQGAFLKAQMAHLGEQARTIAEAAARLAPDGAKGGRD